MKVLLDEMYPAAIAQALRERGCDAIAIQEDHGLRELSDPDVFAAAREAARVLVTENVKDFAPIEAHARARGETHAGLIFTSNSSFPRHRQRFVGAMVAALEKLISDEPQLEGSIHWLQPLD